MIIVCVSIDFKNEISVCFFSACDSAIFGWKAKKNEVERMNNNREEEEEKNSNDSSGIWMCMSVYPNVWMYKRPHNGWYCIRYNRVFISSCEDRLRKIKQERKICSGNTIYSIEVERRPQIVWLTYELIICDSGRKWHTNWYLTHKHTKKVIATTELRKWIVRMSNWNWSTWNEFAPKIRISSDTNNQWVCGNLER